MRKEKCETCDECYHIIIDRDKITHRCDIDNQIIYPRRTTKCQAYSKDSNERIIG